MERISDSELLAEAKRLAASERHATADLVQALVALDTRRLYLAEGCSSLFIYCTRVLRLSEHAAWGRIEAARAARQHPLVLELLREGSITLTTVTLLKPHLTAANHRTLLEAARHRSKRDVELLIATLRPQPDVPATVRKLPQGGIREGSAGRPAGLGQSQSTAVAGAAGQVSPSTEPRCVGPLAPGEAPTPTPAAQPAIVQPLAPERYRIQFTISRDTLDKLHRVQDLLRHSMPGGGDPAAVFDRALTVLLAALERQKLAAAKRPRGAGQPKPGSRHIPASVRRAVWRRDGGRCAFVGAGRRCNETGLLEFHHRVPFADGGPATVDNLELRCWAHNAYEAEQWFGPQLVREMPAAFVATRSGPG